MSSRVGRKPVEISKGVEIKLTKDKVFFKGPKGELTLDIPKEVAIKIENNEVLLSANTQYSNAEAITGTIRALVNNHEKGVSVGFSKKLLLVGVGYRAQVSKAKDGRSILNLTLGLSHPVVFISPKGVDLASAAVTEIEVTGLDKQQVGQVAANIRGICNGLRKPEPYKGKGIRYSDEVIVLKETKKK